MTLTHNRSPNPGGMLPLGRGDDLHADSRRTQNARLLLHAVMKARVHGRPASEDYVAGQLPIEAGIAFDDGIAYHLVNTGGFETGEGRPEQNLWYTESRSSSFDAPEALFFFGSGEAWHSTNLSLSMVII